MSSHVIGFAEKSLSVDPRPSSLNIERLISNLVLINIVIQIILIGFILTDGFDCFEANETVEEKLISTIPSHPPVENYMELVCGTQIRADAYLFYTEKIIFLFLFIAIFYFNKVFIRRLSRYHVIIMGEKIDRYLTASPVYTNINYRTRWKFAIIAFTIYKLLSIVFLAAIIVAAFIFISLVSDVANLLNFEGVVCGPTMKFVKNIDVKLICHFEHEFLIRVMSYLTTSVAIIVFLCFIASFFTLAYYFFKFKNQLHRRKYINEALLAYSLVEAATDDDDSNRGLTSA